MLHAHYLQLQVLAPSVLSNVNVAKSLALEFWCWYMFHVWSDIALLQIFHTTCILLDDDNQLIGYDHGGVVLLGDHILQMLEPSCHHQ